MALVEVELMISARPYKLVARHNGVNDGDEGTSTGNGAPGAPGSDISPPPMEGVTPSGQSGVSPDEYPSGESGGSGDEYSLDGSDGADGSSGYDGGYSGGSSGTSCMLTRVCY